MRASPYHEFLLAFTAQHQVVYGFVEGKDDPCFYRGLIDSVLPGRWSVRLIASGNRKMVVTILENMDRVRFPCGRICFFVDRDLTDFLCTQKYYPENLYVTDGYAIENDVVTHETFGRVL